MEERNNVNESLRKRSSRRRRRTSAVTGNIDKALALFQNKFAIVVVVVVVLIVLVLGLSFCGNGEGADTTTDSGEVNQEETTAENVVDPSTYELQKDAIPQLSELVNTYFTVMKNADAQSYMNIVAGDEMTQEKLEKKGEFIEDYQNIACYTKPGMVEGTYVAFVYYEVKFHNIDTLAPSMSRLYICSNEDGSMYINAGELDQELTGYIHTISNDEQLRLLVKQTDQLLAERCAADEKLDTLIHLLMDGAVVPETEPETTEEPETDISEMVFEERNETVITTTTVRIRSTPTTESDDNILGTIEAGEELKRIGYNVNWSKVIYKGKEAYISSKYVIN